MKIQRKNQSIKTGKVDIALFTSFYKSPSPIRDNENLYCLRKNLANPLIGKVYVFVENGAELLPKSPKLVVKSIEKAPSYKRLFFWANQSGHKHSIISNTDIFFDNTLALLKNQIDDECFALSRWEYHPNSNATLMPLAECSQDTWVFNGKIKRMNANFTLGKPGCDNRIAYEIKKAGHNIINPCYSIFIYHYHQSRLRYYNRQTETVPKPYLTLKPCSL